MKKILIVLAVAVLIPAAVFAGPFGLSLGVNTGYKGELGGLVNDIKAKDMTNIKNFDNYQFGPELRLRLWFLELDANALISSNGSATGKTYQKWDYQVYGNLGLSFSLFNIVRFGAGLGMDMLYKPVDESLEIGPSTLSDANRTALMTQLGGADLKNMALTAPLNVRANIDFNLGSLITLGVEGVLPTNLCIAAISDTDAWKSAYEGAKTQWEKAKVSIYLGFNII